MSKIRYSQDHHGRAAVAIEALGGLLDDAAPRGRQCCGKPHAGCSRRHSPRVGIRVYPAQGFAEVAYEPGQAAQVHPFQVRILDPQEKAAAHPATGHPVNLGALLEPGEALAQKPPQQSEIPAVLHLHVRPC